VNQKFALEETFDFVFRYFWKGLLPNTYQDPLSNLDNDNRVFTIEFFHFHFLDIFQNEGPILCKEEIPILFAQAKMPVLGLWDSGTQLLRLIYGSRVDCIRAIRDVTRVRADEQGHCPCDWIQRNRNSLYPPVLDTT
jgi:hypothetical protein